MKNMSKLGVIASIAIIGLIGFAITACDEGNGTQNTHEHVWGKWTQTSTPTCTTAGIKTRACTIGPSHIGTETQVGETCTRTRLFWYSGSHECCMVR
ncbi:MAG: hypothetical protein LBH43_19980 [Treponema sp.]|jgi:hypothetical protein|nr:hypothetical protein [Treponema sp.]